MAEFEEVFEIVLAVEDEVDGKVDPELAVPWPDVICVDELEVLPATSATDAELEPDVTSAPPTQAVSPPRLAITSPRPVTLGIMGIIETRTLRKKNPAQHVSETRPSSAGGMW